MAETSLAGPEIFYTRQVSVLWCNPCFQRLTVLQNIFNFTTAGDLNCVASLKKFPCPSS